MSKKITFIGDIMLGRMIGRLIDRGGYRPVSDELVKICVENDVTIANLESPVTVTKDPNADHLQFVGSDNSLKQFEWIDCFSLANNHINDAAEIGMNETVSLLEKHGIKHNGLFKKSEDYEPFIIDDDSQPISVITVTDMMNIPFDDDNQWQALRVGEPRVMNIIKSLKAEGKMVIVFAHIGALFTRYPNPVTYNYLHECVDCGADCVVTAHSHCLGGMETYKGVPIFHSLGDFVMDGNSWRRRRSAMLTLVTEGGKVKDWKLTPAIINERYETVTPPEKVSKRMLDGFKEVSEQIAKHSGNYAEFYKWQYKKEMLSHTVSTLSYLIRTRGVLGMLRLVCLRMEEVGRMFKWVTTDRSKIQRDDDAIKADRKKFNQDEIF